MDYGRTVAGQIKAQPKHSLGEAGVSADLRTSIRISPIRDPNAAAVESLGKRTARIQREHRRAPSAEMHLFCEQSELALRAGNGERTNDIDDGSRLPRDGPPSSYKQFHDARQ